MSATTHAPESEDAAEPRPTVSVGEALASIDQLRRLQSVTDAALANLAVDDLMDELLVRVREALSTDTAAILLFDESRAELVARAAKGLEEEVEQGVRIPFGQGFAGTIAATGEPVTILDIDHSNVLNPILRQKGVRSLLGVPLIVHGTSIGVLHVGTVRTRRFSAEDIMLLQLVADRVALAIHAGLYERERAVARTLQRSFLPDRLPEVPGLQIAARYLPAMGGEVGGDWYDVFVLPDGSVGVVMGDVVGRGMAAAAAMGRLRNGLRAYALESSPAIVLEQTNRLLRHLDPGAMATALYGVIDPIRSRFRFASAGHLPPLFREVTGASRLVELSSGPPLGATNVPTFEEREEPLPPGTALVLYTDGLIERRGESLDEGFERLRRATRAGGTPGAMCEHIVSELLVESEPPDDVAILVATITGTEPELHVRVPAEATQLVLIRRVLQGWMNQHGIDERKHYAVIAASGEAVANAIEHAYGPTGGTIELTAERDRQTLVVRVRDFGRWRPPRGPDRGRGTPMIRALADGVELDRSDAGTTVELRWSLS
jgi:anti-sigma regulatory factor (Ser/Thr protein kinase)/putative methionine-R-sulfoxide reductase with GAF domain